MEGRKKSETEMRLPKALDSYNVYIETNILELVQLRIFPPYGPELGKAAKYTIGL